MNRLKTIKDIDITKEDYIYNFQNDLTNKLDSTNWDFTQEIINEIVLWKVNRYALVNSKTLELINKISNDDNKLDEGLTIKILEELLNTKWIQIAMASSILRFKNPNLYQIIDQRVYRFIYGQDLSSKGLKIEKTIELYINYLTKLNEACIKHKINFQEADRILYAIDKKVNKAFKINY